MAGLQGTSISLRTDRDFPKGQEVVASYGQKSSGDLLVSYGFVPPPGTNPHDTYTLTLRVRPPSCFYPCFPFCASRVCLLCYAASCEHHASCRCAQARRL